MKRFYCVLFTVAYLFVFCGVSMGAFLTPAPEGTFTIAVIPDTQRYLGPGSGREEERDTVINPAFESRTAWLAANRETQASVLMTGILMLLAGGVWIRSSLRTRLRALRGEPLR